MLNRRLYPSKIWQEGRHWFIRVNMGNQFAEDRSSRRWRKRVSIPMFRRGLNESLKLLKMA